MIDTKNLRADLRLYIKTGDSAPARNLCTQALDALERKDLILKQALDAFDTVAGKGKLCDAAVAAITKELT